MPGTSNYGWPKPEQTTAPPDVVKWLGDGLDAVDATVKANDAAVNNRLLYGPVGSVPASLPVGVIYFGY